MYVRHVHYHYTQNIIYNVRFLACWRKTVPSTHLVLGCFEQFCTQSQLMRLIGSRIRTFG